MTASWQGAWRWVVAGLATAAVAAPAAQADLRWFAPQNLSSETQDAYTSDLAVNPQGEAAAVWIRTTGSSARIQGAIRNATSPSFGAPTTLSGAGGDDPHVAIDPQGNAVAVWSLFDGTNLRIQAAIRPAGGSFGAEQTLSGAGRDAFDAVVAMDAQGNTFVAWARGDGSGPGTCCGRIEAVTRPAGGSFGATTILSEPGQEAYQPEIKEEVGGEASVVWTRSDGTKLQVQTARLLDFEPYPRVNGAAKLRIALVPAFQRCATSNTTHGTPLDLGSCSPALPSSPNLTVPNDDSTLANGFMTIRFNCTNGGVPPDCGLAGDQADVTVIVNVRDVRCSATHSPATACGSANTSAGEDYSGRLLASPMLRMTDLWSYDGPATVTDTPLPVGVGCTGSPGDLSQGSTCSINTSVDAIVPNMAREGTRAIWAIEEVKVYDAGTDGVLASGNIAGGTGVCPPACRGSDDEKVFETQAVFIP